MARLEVGMRETLYWSLAAAFECRRVDIEESSLRVSIANAP
jgi:hypothetical protein